MHIMSEHNATGFFRGVDLDLHADGALLFRGREIGRVENGVVFSEDHQQVPLTGRLTIGPHGRWNHMEMRPDNTMTMDGGVVVSIDGEGNVMLAHGHGAPTPAHVRIEGYRPDSTHAAMTLLQYGIMKADLATR
jgi:hypothetical protein